jgi:hypothetical protein
VRLLLFAENRLSRVSSPRMARITPRMSMRRAGGMLSRTEKRRGETFALTEDRLGDRRAAGRLTGSGSGAGPGAPRPAGRGKVFLEGFLERVMGIGFIQDC